MSKKPQKPPPSPPPLIDIVRSEFAKGNIVFAGCDELMVAELNKFLSQPIDGILYDLNRSEEVVLTIMKDNPKWVNDFAVCKVIRALHEKLCNTDDVIWVDIEKDLFDAGLTCIDAIDLTNKWKHKYSINTLLNRSKLVENLDQSPGK